MIWLIICAVVMLILMWKFLKKDNNQCRPPDKRMPGPTQWPVIGNGSVLSHRQTHLHLEKLASRFGPIYKLKEKDMSLVVLTDDRKIREALVKKGQDFASRAIKLEQYNPDVSKLINHTIVGKIRGILSSSYDSNINNTNATSEFLNLLSDKDGEPFNPVRDISYFTSSVLAHMVLGDPGSQQVENVSELSHTIFSTFRPNVAPKLYNIFTWLKYFTHNNDKTTTTGEHKIQELVDRIYYACKPAILAGLDDQEDDVSMLHSVFRDIRKKGQTINDEYMKFMLISVISGGSHSITSFFVNSVAVLAHYPEIQKAIYQEVMSVTQGDQPQLQHFDKCYYTNAFIMEVLRNANLAFLPSLHMAVRDTTLAGYDIPKGTAIMAHTWATHHDSTFWSDPFQYKPERFLDENGKYLAADHPVRRRLLPFNTGAMMCPGRVFAKVRLFIGVAAVVQTFTVKPENEVNPHLVDPRVFLPERDIKLRFCSRL